MKNSLEQLIVAPIPGDEMLGFGEAFANHYNSFGVLYCYGLTPDVKEQIKQIAHHLEFVPFFMEADGRFRSPRDWGRKVANKELLNSRDLYIPSATNKARYHRQVNLKFRNCARRIFYKFDEGRPATQRTARLMMDYYRSRYNTETLLAVTHSTTDLVTKTVLPLSRLAAMHLFGTPTVRIVATGLQEKHLALANTFKSRNELLTRISVALDGTEVRAMAADGDQTDIYIL